jgi:RNA polymerase sigma-70 factor (ECF subfamily)
MERRPRHQPSPEDQQKLIASFRQAVEGGDIATLTQMLAEDAVLYSDGGGKVNAARVPVRGRERLAQFLVNINRIYGGNSRAQITEVNGQPAIIVWDDTQLASVFNFTIVDGLISTIQVVVNPDKLRHLEGQLK